MTAFDREVETLRLPDGRRLGWCEYGDPAGRPVLAFHGTPACRLLFAPADTPAARLGLRVIAPDRPGYGQSDPEPGRTLSQWSSDVDALLDHLGVREAPILAISGGGPYAVATAAHLGQRITGLALVSPLGDVGDPKARRVLARLDRTLFVTLPRWPRVVRRVALTGRAAFLAAPEAALMSLAATLSPADRRTLSTPLARRVMIAATREALRQGVGGALSDLDIFSRPWGVDPGAPSRRRPSSGRARPIASSPPRSHSSLPPTLATAASVGSRARVISGSSSTSTRSCASSPVCPSVPEACHAASWKMTPSV
jgi:pimeloyl-ACP methyl ester carboxylesterase